MKCPSLEQLFAYVIPPSPQRQPADVIGVHLTSGCASCGEMVAWLDSVLALAASDDSLEPPPWVVKRALKLFTTTAEPQPTAPRLTEGWRRLVAALVFDSASRTAIAGARAVATRERQLLYHAGAYHIDVQLAASEDERTELSGQILRDDEFKFESVAGLALSLEQEGRMVTSTTTNRFGEFLIAELEPGQYDVLIEAREISITVVGLPVA